MRKIGTVMVVAAALSLASSGVAMAGSGNFSGYGSDSNKSTAEWYAKNNALLSAQIGGFTTGECSTPSVSSTQTPQEWQATAWVSCYRP